MVRGLKEPVRWPGDASSRTRCVCRQVATSSWFIQHIRCKNVASLAPEPVRPLIRYKAPRQLSVGAALASMKALWFKRPLVALGVVGLLFFLGSFLSGGHYVPTRIGDDEARESARMSRSFSDLEASLNNLSE